MFWDKILLSSDWQLFSLWSEFLSSIDSFFSLSVFQASSNGLILKQAARLISLWLEWQDKCRPFAVPANCSALLMALGWLLLPLCLSDSAYVGLMNIIFPWISAHTLISTLCRIRAHLPGDNVKQEPFLNKHFPLPSL